MPEDLFLARDYVRTFSDSLKGGQECDTGDTSPRERLENALKDEVDRQDALTALLHQAVSSPETSGELRDRLDDLATTVARFNSAFPEVANENSCSRSLSWAALHSTISQLQAKHDPRARKGFRGESKKHFHNVCETIHGHMSFLKLLPQGENYTAPITGTLEVIVKASVNHERIGKDFVAALEEIDDMVRAVTRDLLLYSPKFMVSLGVQLCCKIIDFVAIPLKWYLSKPRSRLRLSFDENLSSNYQSEITNIRRLSEEIARGKRHCSEVEVKGIGRNMTEMKHWFDDIRLVLQDMRRKEEENWNAFRQASEEQNRRLQEDPVRLFAQMSQMFMAQPGDEIGLSMKQMIDREAQQFTANATIAETSQVNQQRPKTGPRIEPPQSQSDSRTAVLRGVDVENQSQRLNSFFDLERIRPNDRDGDLFLEGEVAERLQIWTAQTSSSIFCVFGPVSLSGIDAAQLLTSNYVHAARATGIPCVSYFCSVTHQPPPLPRTRETVGLVALVYSLLRQLALHISEQLPPEPMFHQDCFEGLDGTLRTWPQALGLLRDLIAVAAPPYLLIAIHGLEQLEHNDTMPHLESFLSVLRELVDDTSTPETGPKIKVLFATSGMSQLLSEGLTEEVICDISRGNAGLRPGRSGKGRRRFAELGLEDE